MRDLRFCSRRFIGTGVTVLGIGTGGVLSLAALGGGAGALFLFFRGIWLGVDSEPLLDVRDSDCVAKPFEES